MDGERSMNLIPLGQSEVAISPMGIGTWQWGDRLYWGYGRGYAEDEIEGAFRASVDAGVNFFDTAEAYSMGRSEQFLGAFAREETKTIVIATKFFPYPWRLRAGSLRRALLGSLRRLGVERVDLYQIHWPFPPVANETWMEGLADAFDAGLTRAVGVSNYNLEQVHRAVEALATRGLSLASNQVEYSLLHRQPEFNGLLEACNQLGVTVIAYSPLAQGLLTGKYSREHRPTGVRGQRSRLRSMEEIERLNHVLREIGQHHGGKTPTQVALNWVMRKGAVPIPGVKDSHQAKDNVGALGWELTGEDVATLDLASADLS